MTREYGHKTEETLEVALQGEELFTDISTCGIADEIGLLAEITLTHNALKLSHCLPDMPLYGAFVLLMLPGL